MNPRINNTNLWLVSLLTILVIVLSLILSEHSVDGAKNPSNSPNRPNGLRNYKTKNQQQRNKFPLKPEDGRRKSKRAGECRLGKNVHEIGETWNPDLGEPFGIMHCIQCACEAIQKKRRIVGRIRCRNIKNECPKLDCSDAVSIPGQCCKTCPETMMGSDNQTADGNDDSDINENNKEYAALLTPRSSSLIKSSTGLGEAMTTGLGSGRFMFLQRNLYYSFVYNEGMPRPKYVQFVDPEGNVVEEQEVTINNYQSETKKICGVWKKIARVYRKLLKEEKLFAALVTEKIGTDNDRFLAGRISKQKYVTNELYSSLLEPSTQAGTGGMAVITVSASTGSIYLNLGFNGDFEEERDIGITVRLADSSGTGLEESVILPKIQYETNSIEVKTILELDQLQSLSRGTLFIVVYSKKNPDFKLVGFIQARTTCDIFDTILSPEENTITNSAPGLAWVYPLPDGTWTYNIQLPEGHIPTVAKIETGRRLLEELNMDLSQNFTKQVVTGMSSRYFQLLYEDNIYLAVTTNKGTLRGKLSYRGFGDSQLSDNPITLKPGTGADVRAQGLLWFGVDTSCGLNYQLSLSERPQSEVMRLELVEMPSLHVLGLPVQAYELGEFEASEYEGEFHELAKSTFIHMNAGDALFKIVRVNDSTVLASAPLNSIRVPTSCLPTRAQAIDPYVIEPEDDIAPTDSPSKCFYDGKMHEEYSQWSPNNDTCQMCNCYKGKVKCDTMVCPKLDCVNPVLLTGECCRTCLDSEKSQKTFGKGCDVKGDRFHPAGTSWHPYLPPEGFMVCTTCTCNADTLSVECTKQTCPTLNCAPEDAVYPHALSCCKVCPPEKEIDKESLQDDVYVVNQGPSESDILAAGGCKFRGELHINGEEWNHRIEPFGYTPCIVCSCRNGTAKCGRTKCPALNCEVKIKDPGQCCHRCAPATETNSSLSALVRLSSGASSSSSTNPKSGQGNPTRKKSPSKHRTKFSSPPAW